MKTIKFIFLFVLFCVIAQTINAQEPTVLEPDFIGEVLLLNSDGTGNLLEKSPVQFKTKSGASVYIVGIGNTKTRMTVKGCCSNIRVNNSEPLTFVVRAVDNHTDPLSIIKIFNFESKKNERRVEIASFSTFGGTSDNNFKLLSFTAKKYGNSSYLLTVTPETTGEFGIITLNPNALDEKATIVSCFGIDNSVSND